MGTTYVVDTNPEENNQMNAETILAQALLEKEKLLKEHPKLRQLQSEIDKSLENKEDSEERLTTILNLMKKKFIERKNLILLRKQ